MKNPNNTPSPATADPGRFGLLVIGLLKLGKGLLVIAFGIGMLKLVNKDVDQVLFNLITKLHIDAENRFIQKVLAHLSLIDNHTLETIGTISLIFAALLLIEGFGLIFQKLWAEYLTVAETAIFIPIEIFEITKHLTATKIAILIVNVAIVLYLLIVILRKSMSRNTKGSNREQ